MKEITAVHPIGEFRTLLRLVDWRGRTWSPLVLVQRVIGTILISNRFLSIILYRKPHWVVDTLKDGAIGPAAFDDDGEPLGKGPVLQA
jgi:hypothetical protein